MNDQDNNFKDNKLAKKDSISIINEPCLFNENAHKIIVYAFIENGSMLRLNQTSENYLKVSVKGNVFNLEKYYTNTIVDTKSKNSQPIITAVMQHKL